MSDETPDWLPLAAWTAFIEMRKAIRKPLTEYGKKLAIKKLDQLRATGNAPEQVLNQSILNDWQGLWPVQKDAGNGNRRFRQSAAEQEKAIEEYWKRRNKEVAANDAR